MIDLSYLVASAAVRPKAVALLLFVHCLLLLSSFSGDIMFGPCFILQCLVSFLVLQSSRWGGERERERWLLYYDYL